MAYKQFHFSISERKFFLRVFDIIYVIIGLYFVNYLFDFNYLIFTNANIYMWLATLVVYVLFFGEIFELYNLKVASDRYLTLRGIVGTAVLTVIFYVFTPKISPELPHNRIQIIYFLLTVFTAIFLNRFIYITFIFSPRFFKNILLIGNSKSIETVLSKQVNEQGNRFVGYVSNKALVNNKELIFNNLEHANLEELITELNVHEIIISSSINDFNSHKVNNQLINLFEKGVSIRGVDSFLENETFKIAENQLIANFYNYFSFSKSHQNNLYIAFRRFADITFSLIGIVFMVILTPIIFVFNLIGNRGKLFYTQKRVGKKGKGFKIIKYRSMVKNAESNGAVWAQKKDMRITPFGRILRKTRLDEVPQFINVLKGEMSLIGPRPERPEFVAQLENKLPYYALRHVIKPGLSGWAQVMHPYARTVDDQHEKLLFDLYYIKERSLLLDFKIVIKTISTVLFFRGA